ncbi:hypothetical protein BGW36DRAFT_16371 [Talaromyces proteolyticus]|uniref:Glutamyl-tRNA amidotransferase complex subunit Gta3 domain-containing protein n=1 Tax=Talaromyces proteolyticus TaxID=1131652 RepID=A0AAD4L4A5_9EURO|nr:uncharacterized protein BGW36DRAFT_16371 [Talaromyces proteolyticus]KAH8705638.1 hypothetical protein BGW36DRAFT_16371 [Talaromyces proteolyticus]
MPRIAPNLSLPRAICTCGKHLRHAPNPRLYSSAPRKYTSEDIASLFDKPTWSVRSLLPNSDALEKSPSVTPEKLRHLLRLSALPEPLDKEEETVMLRTLESQIHFVKEIQRVNAADVTPLRAIRDESDEATKEATIGLEHLKDALAKEHVVGRRKKIQRVAPENEVRADSDQWDGNALGSATKTIGKYFVVQNRG